MEEEKIFYNFDGNELTGLGILTMILVSFDIILIFYNLIVHSLKELKIQIGKQHGKH